MNDERVFSLGPKFFVDLRRKLWSFMLPLVLVILAVALLVHPPGLRVEGNVRLMAACILTPALLFGAWRGYKQQVASFEGYRLLIGGDRLRRVQSGLPDLEIARGDVVRIVEVPGKGLTVFGPGRLSFISVPASLEGFEEAERRSGAFLWI